MVQKHKYIPKHSFNPVVQARKIEDLQKKVEESATRTRQILDMINDSYSKHLELLANFAGHNMGNAIQTMYASLVKFDESEDWVKEIKGAINTLNGILDSFKEVIPYSDDKLTIPKVLNALETLSRSSCYMEKINVKYIYDRNDNTIVSLPFQYLLQVLHNLMTNSIKALRDIPDKKVIEVEAYIENKECFFFVRDNGVGILPEHLDKIFDYKFTTTEGGSGIGLYYVRYIVEEMLKGNVFVEQNKNHFSTIFNIKIPYGND